VEKVRSEASEEEEKVREHQGDEKIRGYYEDVHQKEKEARERQEEWEKKEGGKD